MASDAYNQSHRISPRDALSNDYHILPPTEKQLNYARTLAQRGGVTLSWEAQQDRDSISTWIDAAIKAQPVSKFSNYASSNQVAFAERIARIKRRVIPHECFRDKTMMSKWIDGNK